MKRVLLLAAVAIFLSCGTEPGATLQIVATLAPNDGCTFEFTESKVVYYSSGIYDPWGYGWIRQEAYLMKVGMVNHMPRADEDASLTVDGNIRQNTRDVTVLGFETCLLDVTDGLNLEIASSGCDDVPERQRFFTPSNFLIPAGGGVSIGELRLFDAEQLQMLFGTGFSLDQIPPRGLFTELEDSRDINGDGDTDDTFYDPSPGDRDKDPNNQAWGSFPDAGNATVLVKARAVGKTQTGGAIESNWHSFPVEVCIGCSVSSCGLLEPITCTDGSAGLEGFEAVYSAESCLPFQDGGLGSNCSEVSTCTTAS